jgi:hypothetical protein
MKTTVCYRRRTPTPKPACRALRKGSTAKAPTSRRLAAAAAAISKVTLRRCLADFFFAGHRECWSGHGACAVGPKVAERHHP